VLDVWVVALDHSVVNEDKDLVLFPLRALATAYILCRSSGGVVVVSSMVSLYMLCCVVSNGVSMLVHDDRLGSCSE
jgi:hypothetical protein